MTDIGRVANGAAATTVMWIAGAIGLAAVLVFFALGQPFGTMGDLAGLVMISALVPVMLAHYELGGIVPLWPARLSLAGATVAVATWAILQAAFVLGVLSVDVDRAATGAWEVQAALAGIIGLWVAGASLLAGGWLPPQTRVLGVVSGVGVVVMQIGLVRGGFPDLLTNVGGVGYQILLPIWAFLLGRVFRARATEASGARLRTALARA